LSIGDVRIARLTQEANGDIADIAQPATTLTTVQAVFIIRHVAHAEPAIFNNPGFAEPDKRCVRSPSSGKSRPGHPDVQAGVFLVLAPALTLNPTAPLGAWSGKAFFQITAHITARPTPQGTLRHTPMPVGDLHTGSTTAGRRPDPCRNRLSQCRLIVLDPTDGAPFFAATFGTKGVRKRAASALSTSPSHGNASNKGMAACGASPSFTSFCPRPWRSVTLAKVTPWRAGADSRLPPRTHFPSQAASLSAPGGLRKARSSAPSGNVLKACQKVAGPGIGLTARKPKAGDASNIF